MNFIRQLVPIGKIYTYSAFGFAGCGAYKSHTMYRQMSKRGDFDKFPKWVNYVMYPMVIQSGMVVGVGVVTYTPIALGVCLVYWKDVYEGFQEGIRLAEDNKPFVKGYV